MKSKLPHYLLLGYLIYSLLLAFQPYDRAVWLSEIIPPLLIVLFLSLTYRKFKFSDTSYLLMSCFVFLHTLGAHYTFERVPFGLVTRAFDFSRNHFDRFSHFTVGFYAYPIAEYLSRKRLSESKWLIALFAVFTIFTVGAAYEIIEWLYALSTAPEMGAAFLGSQGDPWDAQKDMLADGLGAIFAVCLFFISCHKDTKTLKSYMS